MNRPPQLLRTLQLITGALACGCLAFGAIVFFLVRVTVLGPRAPDLPWPILLAILVILIAASVLFPRLTATRFDARARQLLRAGDATTVAQALLQRTVLHAALTEGWGIFGGICVIVTGQIAFALAPFLAAGVLLASFPTAHGFEARLERWKRDV